MTDNSRFECDGCDGDRCVYVGSLCNPVTAADDRGDGNEAEGAVTSKPDELAIAVERVTQIAGGRAIGEVYKNHWRIGVSYRSDLRLILSRLVSQEETIRADEEALTKIEKWFGEFPDTGLFWPNEDGTESDRPMSYGASWGSNGERDFMRSIARARLSARQEGK